MNKISEEIHKFDVTNKSLDEILNYVINFQIRKLEQHEDTLNESTEKAMSNLIRLIEFKKEINDCLIDDI
ncbi:hypothetical protein [uncultured Methanobrevibacter sp.]|uniref:hypothetical protein n=1 Tax=uncultured Methanobrevibacter sp. TaxID=253161 RepID=UPI00260CD26A|nr:hypothetical protein [uncultured Methanobrevibacter sp.]